MNVRTLLAAVALAATAVSLSPASAEPGDLTGALREGGRYVVRPSNLVPVATVALWYRAPQTGFGPVPVPGLAQLAAESISVSSPLLGKPLATRIAEVGGRLAIATYPDSIAITAIVPASRAREIVRVLTTAYFSPVLQDAGIAVAQRDVAQAAVIRTFSAEGTLDDRVLGALFSEGPAHAPHLGTPQAIVAIETTAVRAFAERAFRAQNATLVLTGAVDASLAAEVIPGRPATEALAAAESPAPSLPAPHPSPVATSAPGGAGIGLGWIGPAIADEREATALDFLTDYLFRPDFGVVARALPPALAINGRFVTYHDPGVVLVTAFGADANAALPTIRAGVDAATIPLEAAAFAAAKRAFVTRILGDLSSPPSEADTLGWYAVEGNLPYAPGMGGTRGSYFANANALTAAFVAATARKYLGVAGALVTIAEPKATP